MPIQFHRLFAAICILVLSYLTSASADSSQPLVLEKFFQGKTIGKGVFESDIAGVRRPFTVYLTGTWSPATSMFRLREDFVYEDGERDTKTWFFEKLSDGRYIGHRSDVIGQVLVLQGEDGALRFSYIADVPRGDGSILLRFDDTLTQVDRRTVRNTARVLKAGILVGTVDLTFAR
ncbi:DUF3833 family protein [Roseibium denhamense]|uniref:DUF3833 family protein n=1 Tax=Roseibium denhamense TaxID=76305 RepID=A0ABY1N5X4_9HYPH|nr:DUF3833 family protein [Roseibium denhamense]MTI04368.1 DUF3833 family protein [Roseibium denhamense]SMP00848.1 Protein of unknown function [Roseibium denhamense]